MNQSLIRWTLALCLFLVMVHSLTASALTGDPATFKFDLDSCNAWLPTDDNNDFSEFIGTAINTNEITMSAVGGHLYRLIPEENGHSCTAGLNGTNAMCVSASEDCLYQAGSEQSIRFDIELNPTGNKFVQLSELNFQEMAPELFSWNDGFTSVNDYPTRYALRVLKEGEVIYQQEDIQTTQEWSLESFTFAGSEFTVGIPTVFNFELLAYCPIGIGAIQHVWDVEDIEITAICLDQNITNGGEITGGPFNYCIEAGSYFLPAIGIFFATGQNQDWVVTNGDGEIIALPDNIEELNFAALGGTLFVQNISYQNGLAGLTLGLNIGDLQGVYSLSNSITVTGINPVGGMLDGGPFSFCVDGSSDFVSGLTLTGNSGTNMQWVVTDPTGIILGLPENIEEVDFDAAGVGDCFIYNVSYEELTGLAIDSDIEDLEGCFDISSGVLVNRRILDGGTLVGGPFNFCVDDVDDFISDINLTEIEDDLEIAWVITDVQLNILGIPDDPTSVNFNDAGPGVCFLWGISYLDSLGGLEIDNTISDLSGCFGISNSIQIERIQPAGGNLEGGPFEFCVDGVADHVSGITLSNATGEENAWIVTDEQGVILGLPADIEEVDFDAAGVGLCLIWNISQTGQVDGLSLNENVSDLSGCFGISDSIVVIRSTPNGGMLTGGPYDFCIDGQSDFITDIVLENNTGTNSSWLITDEEGNILGIPADITEVNFNAAGGGVCLIYNISYQDGLTGLVEEGNIENLEGCFGFSNSISVNRTNPMGGTLTGGPFEFCIDGEPDMVSDVSVAGNAGVNSSWMITDTMGEILGVTNEIDTIDFNGAGAGVCLIWNISYGSDIVGLEVNNMVDDLQGCFAISDSIVVSRTAVEGGTLTGGPYDFCLDGISDFANDLNLADEVGSNKIYLITDADSNILETTNQVDTINFDGATPGICLIWNLSYEDGILGLNAGNNISDLQGCFDISNSVSVTRSSAEGGTLTSEDFDFIIDGTPDMVSGIVVSDTSAANYSWIVTDVNLEIVGLPANIEDVDFDTAGPGICLIWYVGYSDGLQNLELGNNINDLEGCFDISSNSITVTRTASAGGVLEGGPFNFCVDGVADMVSGITLTGAMGANMQWVITNAQDSILGLPADIEMVDFDAAGAGICYIYHLTYEDNAMGISTGNFLSDITGTFALSNSLVVTRSQPSGGSLSSDDFNFTVDGTPDMVSGIIVSDTSAANYSWIITDENLEIIGVPGNIEEVDFDAAGPGICLIWYIGYEDGLQNLVAGNNISDLIGCFGISSNSITVNRVASAGGVLAGGPFDFCVDGNADMVSGITITGAMGANSQWVITNAQDSILGLPADIEMVDFDAAGVGVCYIYHLSYEDNTMGIATGNFLSDIMGTFALSNSIVVNRTQPSGGTLSGGPYSFCIDDESDFITDLVLTGNMGSNTQWIVTDENENIITVTDSIQNIDFNLALPGTCLIWSITYEDGINGLINDSPLNIIEGCFNLSNSIEVTRSQISGGTLEGGPFNFCIDMTIDTVSNITLGGATGDNNSWLITDEEGLILGVPDTITNVDFNLAGSGICFIYNISYQDGLSGLVEQGNISDLAGCYDLSNSIMVSRSEPMAAVLEGGPFSFTIDGIEDNVSGITVTGGSAPNEQWIVASPMGIINIITDDIENVNFDSQEVGECLIYHIGFLDGISGFIEGNNLDDIEGCFAISNSISVTKMASMGGTLTGGPFNFCIDDESDFVSGLEVTENTGSITTWIVTDPNGEILELPTSIQTVDFNAAGVGLCYIYSISYDPPLTGLTVGANISELMGAFGLSNSVEVNRSTPEAGVLTGGPFEFCVEGTPDMVTGINLTGNSGANTSWVITDNAGVILGVPDTLENVNFDEAGAGICLIYSITYNDGLEGLEVDSMLTNLDGCFDLTDNIVVTRNEISGGILTGGPFNFCIDGVADNLTGISLTDFIGPNLTWVVTDSEGVITHLVESLGEVDFDQTGGGTCFVYNLTFETGITGLVINGNIDNLQGCFSLSDPITVNKTEPNGGTVSGDSFEFCIDNVDDFVTDVSVSGNVGANSSWLITNASGEILGVPADILNYNFNNQGPGTCFVWHISYEDGLDGLFVGESVMDLDGCYSISVNNIAVTKIEPLGGSLSPTTYSFCKDGLPDLLLGLTLVDTVGVNHGWVITDLTGVILDLPVDIDTYDFDDSDLGTCLVYNITYEDGLLGLNISSNISDLTGCYSFSNSVQVIKEDCVLMSNDSIVINEIFPDENQVELKNLSDQSIDVSSYWLCQFPAYGQLANLVLDCSAVDYILDPGEILVVEFNATLSPNNGEIALYNDQVIDMNDFNNSNFIIDYVEWGTSGHMRSSVAVDAGIWTTGDFVPSFSITNSIEYDGIGNSSFDWSEDSPTVCTENSFTDPSPIETKYSLYPNPGVDEISLEFNEAPASKINARVYNSFGKLVIAQSFDLEFGEEPRIDIKQLNEGAYILEVYSKGFSQTQRFIKIN